MSMVRPLRLAGLLAVGAVVAACSDDNGSNPQPRRDPVPGILTGNITANRTLSKDTIYTLRGNVVVTNGATLTIPGGTRLIGDTLDISTAMYITRGSRIVAGPATGACTADSVVVFTSGWPAGRRRAGDWGGLVVVGNGISNLNPPAPVEAPPSITLDYAGGTNAADNSGRIRCARFDYAGYTFGGGNELNSLSLYSVGSGTQVEYVEVFASLDDAFQWQGGSVDGRYFVTAESGDDDFDVTEGFNGRVQHIISLNTTRVDPRLSADNTGSIAFEVDGCSSTTCKAGGTGAARFNSTPFTMAVFANVTAIRYGNSPTSGGITPEAELGMRYSTGAGGAVLSAVFHNFWGGGLLVRDTTTWNQRHQAQDSLNFYNIVFSRVGGFTPTTGASAGTPVGTFPVQLPNSAVSNMVAGVSTFGWTAQGVVTQDLGASPFVSVAPASVDFTPAAGSTLLTRGSGAGGTGVALPASVTSLLTGFPRWNPAGNMPQTAYIGAAPASGPDAGWWRGWTTWVVGQ